MNDIVNVIGILQAVRNELRAKQPGLCWGDLSAAIEDLQQAITLLSPPADEPADEPEQPETPPPLSGEWQSCEHGIDVDGGDLVLYAWRGKLGWQYAAARVSCDVDDEDGSGPFELLDWDGNQVELEPSDYYLRIKR